MRTEYHSRIICLLQGYIHFRSFLSLHTRNCYWVPTSFVSCVSGRFPTHPKNLSLPVYAAKSNRCPNLRDHLEHIGDMKKQTEH
jgi:hypothetical protein